MVATVDYQVPPVKYGSVHSLVNDLAHYMAAKGHEVTVFAAADSAISGENITLVGTTVELVDDPVNPYRKAQLSQFLQVLAQQAEFDLIHWHYDPIALNCFIDGREFNFHQFVTTRSVTTLHFAPSFGDNMQFYKAHRELWDHNFVSISQKQRAGVEFLNFIANIYHGIDLETFKFNPIPEAYLLFLGRISPEKGIVEAIEVAKKSGKKLLIAAKLYNSQQQFFDTQIKPHLGDQIVYLGEVGLEEKVQLYQNAAATLFPISWEEPFGLVLIESLACGTPVIAFNRGSVSEILANGKTGFVVDNLDGMVAAVGKIGQLKREDCRQAAETRFSNQRMLVEYERLYSQIVSSSAT